MKYILNLQLLFSFILLPSLVCAYDLHKPIIVENIQTTVDKPYIVEGYEITDPNGPGIQIREVDYVVIRNNYIHDCGTKISEGIQKQIKDTGKTTLSAMNKPFDTGGILIFDAKSVEVYNNKVINNDYGIFILGHNKRPDKVSIYDNVVKNSHRASFIYVRNADNVDVSKNDVEDNGLDIFMDNKGLMEAFKRGKDFPDGRSQGIAIDGCNHVKISDNTVINSSSDGIGVFAGTLDYVQDIDIYDNTVLRNGEQGIWIVKARNGKIHNNTVKENRHRKGEMGGSSGIVLEGEVYNFEIYNNNIGYNDVFGICLIGSSNNNIYDNQIYHNGDGAFGWNELFYWRDDYYKKDSVNGDTIIKNNNIHHNRRAVFVVNTSILDNVIVEDNIIMNNGGNPIHYEYYDDYKTETHPGDWEYNKKSELLIFKNKEQANHFKIGENKIDVKNMKSMPDSNQSYMYQDLPDISTFIYQKSDRFIVDMDDITGGSPFKGINSKQPHAGAHINFNNKDNRWSKGNDKLENYPPIYAVSDGFITRVDESFTQRTGNDRYGVAIAFAKDDKGDIYQLCYSIEPMIPEPSKAFYSKFIKVVQEQKVHKGDIIAYMYIPPSIEHVHIHLHIQRMNQNGFMAPAIFTQEVVDQFHARWKEWGKDGDVPMPSCMGYMLGPLENPFGSSVVDKL
jgi:parallel beta-helix repeat protein